jgi:hypothetical protein
MSVSKHRMARTGYGVALLLLFGGGEWPASPVSDPHPVIFEREVIEVTLGVGRIRVAGTYHFRNNSDSPLIQGLYYPVPVDSTHPFPDRIVVTVGADTLDYQTSPAAVMFRVLLPAGGPVVVRVCYEQACPSSDACYILTTTAAWNRPLNRADFFIRVPDDLILEWAAYDIDEVTYGEGVSIHQFSRMDFMPDRDLCLRWRVR